MTPIAEHYQGDIPWVPQATILLVRHGSQAYGTALPGSDLDVRGVAIPPQRYFTGFLYRFEQAEQKPPLPDLTIFDIRKFFQLAADCNPNIIEILWVDPSDILYIDHWGRWLLQHRSDFLSQKAKYTFSGYAISQLKRIRTHRKWLLNPPKAKPERRDFGLPETTAISADQMGVIAALLAKEETVLSVSEDVMTLYARERSYHNALTQWAQYQTWKKSRNPSRAALEAQFGYDCYSEDTEFLTQEGWKKFDNISTEYLATVRLDTGELEWQRPTARIDKFSDTLYEIRQNCSRAVVTANHNLLVSPVRRSRKNGFSTVCIKPVWDLISVENLLGSKRLFYHTRKSPSRREKSQIHFSDDFLALGGLYLSDGSMEYRGGQVKCLRLSQKKRGKYRWAANRLMSIFNMRRYDYEKETVWVLHGSIAGEIERHFGSRRLGGKKLPPWALHLSSEEFEILWDHWRYGDGTKYSSRDVIYTSSRQLADQLQAAALCAGFCCARYGPYANNTAFGVSRMYHVVRPTKGRGFGLLSRKNLHLRPEGKSRVVCFTVPNGTLITRNNGLSAIHGNCKHAMHLVRLMRMCREILTEGVVFVRRPDAEELLAIRNGAWEYDQLIEWAEKQDAELEELVKTSPLPHSPDRVFLDKLCREMVQSHFSILEDAVPPNTASK